jgi:hypothetical protein
MVFPHREWVRLDRVLRKAELLMRRCWPLEFTDAWVWAALCSTQPALVGRPQLGLILTAIWLVGAR